MVDLLAFMPCRFDVLDVSTSLRARSFIDIQKSSENLFANVLPSGLQPINLTGFIGA